MPINDNNIMHREPAQHNRTNSLQHSIVRDAPSKSTEESHEEETNLGNIINDLCAFKNENEELHHIYDQECLALKFKKTQTAKLQAEYQRLTKELAETQSKLKSVQEE